jgi:SAM-dependent methyltransferase
MSVDYLHRKCPICQKKTEISPEVCSETKAEALSYEELVPYWNGFFKEKIFFSYARCQVCDLLFAPVFYRLDQLEALYGQMPPNMDVVPISALLKTQRGYFKELKKGSNLENGYIEIGPDVGIFTVNCVAEGRFDKYWLCEPNKAVANTLARVVDGHEFVIIKDMFGFSAIPDRSAGAAVMIQVLDHLLDPVATLKELGSKLKPEGKLLLVTHNEQSILRNIIGWKWPAFCLQHPQIYSPKSIFNLLEASGYEVESISRSKNYFELSFLLKHLLWALGLKVKTLPKIFNFPIGLKLGNIITVASIKK